MFVSAVFMLFLFKVISYVTGGTENCDLIATPPEVLSPSSFGLSPSLVSILSTNIIITISIVLK